MANHASTRTTQLYGRRAEEVTLDERSSLRTRKREAVKRRDHGVPRLDVRLDRRCGAIRSAFSLRSCGWTKVGE
jgi:hypothetical protein